MIDFHEAGLSYDTGGWNVTFFSLESECVARKSKQAAHLVDVRLEATRMLRQRDAPALTCEQYYTH